ncbi:MAG: hypothetical protein HS104_19210 [Polyangiaceae bacterium]|nr:hypothetical protein [Polyangiaceae bacterium]MCL4752487.1 hypothetical protein [Myxococcales bacterium]
MGGRTQSASATVGAKVWLADPDYSGPFELRVFHGTLGGKVEIAAEQKNLSAGRHVFELDLAAPGEHFF